MFTVLIWIVHRLWAHLFCPINRWGIIWWGIIFYITHPLRNVSVQKYLHILKFVNVFFTTGIALISCSIVVTENMWNPNVDSRIWSLEDSFIPEWRWDPDLANFISYYMMVKISLRNSNVSKKGLMAWQAQNRNPLVNGRLLQLLKQAPVNNYWGMSHFLEGHTFLIII